MACFSLHVNVVFVVVAVDTLYANQSLSGDQTIVSADKFFELGFFNPRNSSNHYVGIWYHQITPQTVVWVANREIPVSDKNSAQLRISDGNLVLFNESKVPIWSTNMSSSSPNLLKAILLDTGNLVLKSGSTSSSSRYLWQIFDYPTHTWLPGGKIRFDKRINQSQLLTSWKNSENPASGLFSLELDPKGSKAYFLLWNKTKQYWTSGPWDGHIFSLVPEMRYGICSGQCPDNNVMCMLTVEPLESVTEPRVRVLVCKDLSPSLTVIGVCRTTQVGVREKLLCNVGVPKLPMPTRITSYLRPIEATFTFLPATCFSHQEKSFTTCCAKEIWNCNQDKPRIIKSMQDIRNIVGLVHVSYNKGDYNLALGQMQDSQGCCSWSNVHCYPKVNS